MSTSYHSWPLGRVPEDLQRSEWKELAAQGIEFGDPREAIALFERELAALAGARYAVSVDSCTSGVFLALKYRGSTGRLEIPRNTYVSIPMAIIHAGARPVARTLAWSGVYEIGNSGIIDSATRFTEGMYEGGGSLQVLSFQYKKRLPIGRGGAVLTDDREAYEWLKLASYDGRDLTTSYASSAHVRQIGWHLYMTPEDAARGLLLMGKVPRVNADSGGSDNYPDWSDFPAFSEYAMTGTSERGPR